MRPLRRREPAARPGGGTLTLELRRSGIELTVPDGHTALEAIERAGVDVASLCRVGFCGTCETRPANAPRPVRLCVTTGNENSHLVLDL